MQGKRHNYRWREGTGGAEEVLRGSDLSLCLRGAASSLADAAPDTMCVAWRGVLDVEVSK